MADSIVSGKARRYAATKQAGSTTSLFTMEQIRTHPESFGKKRVEAEGTVFALASGSDGARFLLRSGATDSTGVKDAVEVLLPPNDRIEMWPELVEGNRIRALCRIARDPDTREGVLELVMPIEEWESRLAGVLTRSQEIGRAHGVGGSAAPGEGAKRYGSDLRPWVVQAIQVYSPGIDASKAQEIAGWLVQYSTANKVDPRLVVAMIGQESEFRVRVTSHAGASGLCQLMPGTARQLGVRDACDPEQNLRGGIAYLAGFLREFRGKPYLERVRLALASYNAGRQAVRDAGDRIPQNRETPGYVANIVANYLAMVPPEEQKASFDRAR